MKPTRLEWLKVKISLVVEYQAKVVIHNLHNCHEDHQPKVNLKNYLRRLLLLLPKQKRHLSLPKSNLILIFRLIKIQEIRKHQVLNKQLKLSISEHLLTQ